MLELAETTASTTPATHNSLSDNQNDDNDPKLNVTMMAYIIGVAAAAVLFILLLVLAIVVFRRRKKPRRSIDLFISDVHDTTAICMSAPISRSSSPKNLKRKSCPDAYGAFNIAMVRSATVDNIPDFSLPAERVQPYAPDEKSRSLSPLQYQNSFLGAIQPKLYRYDGVLCEDEHQLDPSLHGRIWFSTVYDVTVEQLNVTLVKSKELPLRTKDGTPPDPFVKVFLLPDERTCRTSKVRKKTTSPVFNETFIFQVPNDELYSRNLRFSVYDVDKRRLRHCLGHVFYPLQEMKTDNGDVIWRDMELNSQNTLSAGELNIGLTFLPHMEKMKIVILRTRNLKHVDFSSDAGIQVKILFYYGRKHVKTKRTMIQHMSQDTNFNESFTFNMISKHIDSCNFVVRLSQTTRGALTHCHELGHVTLGSFMYARGEGLLHWQDMLAQTRTTVCKWHPLTMPPSTHS